MVYFSTNTSLYNIYDFKTQEIVKEHLGYKIYLPQNSLRALYFRHKCVINLSSCRIIDRKKINIVEKYILLSFYEELVDNI